MSTPKISRNTLTNAAVSFGATVVIIGLMFKILHFANGEFFIGIGLAVEALLFSLLGFQILLNPEEPPHKLSKGAIVHQPADQLNPQLDQLLNKTINQQVIDKLTAGFDNFTKTVDSVNHITSYAGSTQKMIDEVNQATAQMSELKNNIAQLNNIYRAQLEAFRKN
jgi:hypothetical protein